MLYVEIDEENSAAILEPHGALSKSDFVSASEIIDPYIETSRPLKGIIIHVRFFPGWDSFAALSSHFKFVGEHHKKISRVAFATDSVVGSVAKAIASHFVDAEIKVFSFEELASAKQWINNSKL